MAQFDTFDCYNVLWLAQFATFDGYNVLWLAQFAGLNGFNALWFSRAVQFFLYIYLSTSVVYLNIYLHWSVLLLEETGGPRENHLPVASHWPPRYNWNSVDSGVKHHKTKLPIVLAM